MPDCVRITECRLCDSRDLDLIVSFPPTPPGDAYLLEPKPQVCYPLDLLMCRGCGAVQLADIVDPMLIYPEYLYLTSLSRPLCDHFVRYAHSAIQRLKPPAHSLVMDIGSNDGTLLQQFQLEGYRVLGIDPAAAIAERARSNGIPTITGFFGAVLANELNQDGVKPQIITANHILANVADLHDVLEGIRILLAPKGTFIFETGYWPAIMRGNLIDTIEHEHIHYFAVGPLVRLFARHGLRLVAVEEHPVKGGSLRGFVQHAAGSMAGSTVRRASGHEHRHGYADRTIQAKWVARVDGVKQAIGRLIDAKGEDKWIGYGAAVGSTLLLHYFGLGPHLECLVDGNTLRHGRYSPGYHLRVCPPIELVTRNPQKVIILAWRYAQAIMAQHHDSAGRCMIPLPELRFA